MVDLHQAGIAVAPLAAHERDPLGRRQVHDGVGTDAGRVRGGLRRGRSRERQHDEQWNEAHHRTFTT
jgi:hypothetical protein